MCYPSDMRYFTVFVLVLFFSASAFAEPPIRVIDGDTFERDGYRYRVWGIDAPESAETCPDGYPMGREAAKFLELMLANDVTCSVMDRDRYGRIVTRCTVDATGDDVASLMVGNGFAWDWPRYSNGRYSYWEDVAQASHSGVWAHGCRWGRS